MKDGSWGGSGDHTSNSNSGPKSSNAGSGGGGGGSSYTFSNYKSNPNISGNWNTGGSITGYGNMSGGIVPAPKVSLPSAMPKPTGYMQTPIRPPVRPPIPRMSPWTDIGVAIDYFDAQNPNGLFAPAPPNNNAFKNPGGNYPAQYNGGGPGNSFNSQKDQSRLGGNGPGVGGGYGGGGGGGW